jgi:predicted metal-dependent hydrolase
LQGALDFEAPLLNTGSATGLSVRRSARARRLSVRVFRDGRVEVVVPPRASERTVAEFVRRHGTWIERQRARSFRERSAALQQPVPPARIELPAFDEVWRVHLAGGSGAPRLRAAMPGLLSWRGHALPDARSARALLRWLMGHARVRLGSLLVEVAAETGLQPGRMELRRQRSRWGSCSTHGTISLNVCLAFQPAPVVRYLMIHELTHLEHMNHSAHFWAAVARRCPQWRELDRELLQGWRRVPQWLFA